MVEKITDQYLEHSKDDAGNNKKGEWILPIAPLTYGDYKFVIDYDSDQFSDEDKVSFQYGGYIVVGKTPIMIADPVIVSYQTNATQEKDITQSEKRNSSFTISLKCKDPSSLNQAEGIEHLPFEVRFLKGTFKDYNAKGMKTTLKNDKYNAMTIPNYTNFKTWGLNDVNSKGKLISKQNYGRKDIEYNIGMLYSKNQKIQQYNTIFFICNGTVNRGIDNYVPKIIAVPLILGTRSVWLKITGLYDSSYDTTGVYARGVRGGGTINITVDFTEAFAHNNTNIAKVGYEDYLTKSSKKIKEGYITLQRKYTDGTWHDVPKEELDTTDEDTIISNTGQIAQTNNYTGQVSFNWTNSHSLKFKGSETLRLYYHGVVGKTKSQISPSEYVIQMKPDNKSDIDIALHINIDGNTNDLLQYLALTTHSLPVEIQNKVGFNSKLEGKLRVVITKKED